MSKTRFMTALFSATESGDEELTNQVAGDISAAKRNGSFEDDEMSYEDLGDEGVLATDKMNGEQTLIHNEVSEDGTDKWVELSAYPEYCVGDYVHPEINPDGSQVVYAADEIPVENPREFSVATDNQAVLRIFSDQDMVETVAESVYQSEQEAQVGDLKFEKSSDNDGIIVTSLSSGDKAMVELDGPDMRVTELDQKNFKSFSNRSNMNVISRRSFSDEQYEPIFVVALDPVNKVLVNSPVYGEAAAQELAGQLAELGLVGVNIFADPDEGRDYALALLCGEGVESTDQIGDEEEAEVAYSDQSVICNRYFTDRTRFMNRMFSEAEEEITDHQDIIEDAIESDEQIETEDYIITPVDEDTAVIEDKDSGEFTVAELDGEDINVEGISEDEAAEMIDSAEEHDYSDYLDYMQRQYGVLDDLGITRVPASSAPVKPEVINVPNASSELGIRVTKTTPKKGSIFDIEKGAKEYQEFLKKNGINQPVPAAHTVVGSAENKAYRKLQEEMTGKLNEANSAAQRSAKQLGQVGKRYRQVVGQNRDLAAQLERTNTRLDKYSKGYLSKSKELHDMGGVARWIGKNKLAAAGIGAAGLAAAGLGGYYAGQKNNSDYYDYDDRYYADAKEEKVPGWFKRKINGAVKWTEDAGEKMIGNRKEGNYIRRLGELVKKHPKASLAVGSSLAAAGVGGLGYAGYKLYEGQKEESDVYDRYYADEAKPGFIKRNWNAAVDKMKKIVDETSKKGGKWSEKDNKAVKKIGNFVKNNPKAALALATAAGTATVGGLGYGGYKLYKGQKEESDTRMFDDATLAQIEDQATEAIQNVQEAAETAINAIQQAKNEPVDNSSDIQEATYSDRMFSDCKSLDEVW